MNVLRFTYKNKEGENKDQIFNFCCLSDLDFEFFMKHKSIELINREHIEVFTLSNDIETPLKYEFRVIPKLIKRVSEFVYYKRINMRNGQRIVNALHDLYEVYKKELDKQNDRRRKD